MRTISASLLAIAMFATCAKADDLTDCSQHVDLRQTIDGCTRAASGALSGRLLAMVFNNRANAYGALAERELAIEDYGKAIAIDPTYTHAYYNRGATLMEVGRPELAVADFDRALQIDPGLAKANVNRGLARLQLGLVDGAIDDFSAAIALEPDAALAYNNRGAARRRKGELTSALADFDKAIELDSRYRVALNNRGEVLQALGRAREAVADFQRVLATDPTDERARRNLERLQGDRAAWESIEFHENVRPRAPAMSPAGDAPAPCRCGGRRDR